MNARNTYVRSMSDMVILVHLPSGEQSRDATVDFVPVPEMLSSKWLTSIEMLRRHLLWEKDVLYQSVRRKRRAVLLGCHVTLDRWNFVNSNTSSFHKLNTACLVYDYRVIHRAFNEVLECDVLHNPASDARASPALDACTVLCIRYSYISVKGRIKREKKRIRSRSN